MKEFYDDDAVDDPLGEESDAADESGGDGSDQRDSLLTYFIQHICSEDEFERRQALRAVRELECDPGLSGILEHMLRDNDKIKNTLAVECIGLWKHTDGTDMLINFMTDAANREKITDELIESVLIALGQIGDPGAFEYLSRYALTEFSRNESGVCAAGMVCNESIMTMATRGQEKALRFLISGCRHSSWNMRESCAACLGAVYAGKDSLPNAVYEELMRLTADENRNVRIAAYMSLDEIIGLDESNKRKLAEVRNKQMSDEKEEQNTRTGLTS